MATTNRSRFETLRAVLEHSHEPIVLLDRHDAVAMCSRGALRLFELTDTGAPVGTLAELLRVESDEVDGALREARGGDRAVHVPVFTEAGEGTERHLDVSIESAGTDGEMLLVFIHDLLDDRRRSATSTLQRKFNRADEALDRGPSPRPPGARGHASVAVPIDKNGDRAWVVPDEEVAMPSVERPRRARDNERWSDAEVVQQRLAFLASASEVLSSSLDYETTLASVAQLAVPEVADWCGVDIIGIDGRLERLAVAHVDPKKVKWARQIHEKYPPDPDAATGVMHVIRTGRTEYYPDLPQELLEAVAINEEMRQIIREIGFTSVIVAPLSIRGQTLGAISFVASESGYHYTPSDVALAEDLARRAAVAIDNARLYRQVERQRQRLNNLVANVPGIVWEAWDEPDERLQRVNFVSDYVEQLLGYTPEAWTSTRYFWLDLVHPDDRQRVMEEGRATFEGRRDGFTQFRMISRDGWTVWVEARSTVIRDDDGKSIGMRGVIMDLSERRKAAEALRLSEERFQLITRATNDALWDWNLETDTVWWNRGLQAIGGYTDDEVENSIEWWRRRVHPEDMDRVVEGRRRVIHGSEHFWADEYRFRRADEGYAYIYDRGHVMRDVDGRAVRMLGAMIDISERKRAELELTTAKEEAEAANRAKDRFLAMLSHELRTPLTPVLASAQVLAEDASLPADVREIMDLVQRNIELEANLIDDLLDLTRISRGKLRLELEPVDVHPVIHRVLDICRAASDTDGLTIDLDLAAAHHCVEADPARLSQIVWNLVRNAIKFTAEGGNIRIDTLNPDPDHIRIDVIDTGIGIAPEVLPRIFDAFEQGGSEVTREFGGLGLGLAITSALVEMHEGTITAHSDGTGTGSTFSVTLRIRDDRTP